MKKYFIVILVAATSGLFSCGNANKENKGQVETREAKGGKSYGGIFRLNEPEYIKNLFPHSITDVYSYRVACQIYEGLFKFDQKDLEVIPVLAESYTLSPDGKIYSIKLKKGVYFHDDPAFPNGKGREMTAHDVKYAFTKLCTQGLLNQNFSVFKDILLGANEYYKATADNKTPDFGVEGIKVIDDYTIEFHLIKPNALFLTNLARPACFVYPKEAEEKYGQDMRIKAVGTGPFAIKSVDEDISIILKKNENYHGKDEHGNQLPFLDAISIQFIKDKKTELLEFKKGNLDMIYRLPTEYIIEILEEAMTTKQGEIQKFELQRSPEMVTQFLTFNNQSKIFNNVNVRKAFSYAIDRDKILDYVLNGEGYASGHHGITPPVFNFYNIDQIHGYKLNVDSARYYLAKAGFPNGKGLPKIEFYLNSEGTRNTNVAVEIQKQLKDNLNVDIELNILPFAQMMENGLNGKFNLMRASWYADYPNPENFLWLFYGKDVPKNANINSYPNIARYTNPEFDNLYEKALNAKTIEEANELFLKAEKILMKDAPVIVLWYDEGYRLLQSYVKNFENNPMQYRDFSQVYLQKAKKIDNI
jgi:oligopeptide transport system substrate-binding protein